MTVASSLPPSLPATPASCRPRPDAPRFFLIPDFGEGRVQGTNLDDFPNKPRNRLEFHLLDVLLQHFHEDLVVWFRKDNSRKQVRYDSLVTSIRGEVEKMNYRLCERHITLK